MIACLEEAPTSLKKTDASPEQVIPFCQRAAPFHQEGVALSDKTITF